MLMNHREGGGPAGGRAPDALALANRLRPVLFRLTRELRRETHSLGVTARQVTLLATIGDREGIGIGELAASEQLRAPSVCTHVDRLEEGGMVRRVRAAPGGDRRRVGLVITADGRRVLAAVRSRRTAWLAARLAALGAADRERIDAAVEPLALLLGEDGR